MEPIRDVMEPTTKKIPCGRLGLLGLLGLFGRLGLLGLFGRLGRLRRGGSIKL